MKYWENIRETLIKSAETFVDLTKEVANSADVRTRLFLKKKDIQNAFNELGNKAFEQLKNKKTNLDENKEIQELVRKIERLESECAQIEKEIKNTSAKK